MAGYIFDAKLDDGDRTAVRCGGCWERLVLVEIQVVPGSVKRPPRRTLVIRAGYEEVTGEDGLVYYRLSRHNAERYHWHQEHRPGQSFAPHWRKQRLSKDETTHRIVDGQMVEEPAQPSSGLIVQPPVVVQCQDCGALNRLNARALDP